MKTLRLPGNDVGRDFIVGDIHGCIQPLNILLTRIGFDRACDRLFSVGDLVDRGPHSPQAIALLDEPWFFAVQGNHEEFLVRAAADPDVVKHWDSNGGSWARAHRHRWDEWAQTLEPLPLAIVVGEGEKKFNVVHAEFYGSQAELEEGDFDEITEVAMKWGRVFINEVATPSTDLVRTYVGHTPVREPVERGPFTFIDTGACFSGGYLTMAEHALHPIYHRSAPKAALSWE